LLGDTFSLRFISPSILLRSASSLSGRQLLQEIHQQQQEQQPGRSSIKTEVVEFSIARDGVKSYAIYTIIVSFTDERGCEEVRQVFRR
jgi:hypothetical protein